MPDSMDLCERDGELALYLSTPTGFKVLDVKTATLDDFRVPGLDKDTLGTPIRGLLFPESFIFCFESKFVIGINGYRNRSYLEFRIWRIQVCSLAEPSYIYKYETFRKLML